MFFEEETYKNFVSHEISNSIITVNGIHSLKLINFNVFRKISCSINRSTFFIVKKSIPATANNTKLKYISLCEQAVTKKFCVGSF